MDFEKAIRELKENIEMPFGSDISEETSKIAIQALEELQEYRQIGTVEDCRVTMNELIELQEYRKLGTVKELWAAREKQIAKTPVIGNDKKEWRGL